MAKGAESKSKISEKLLATFPGSFINGKEIRIPMMEDGNLIEIKVTLTAAKDVIGGAAASDAVEASSTAGEVSSTDGAPLPTEPTDEEKQKVADLLSALGLS